MISGLRCQELSCETIPFPEPPFGRLDGDQISGHNPEECPEIEERGRHKPEGARKGREGNETPYKEN